MLRDLEGMAASEHDALIIGGGINGGGIARDLALRGLKVALVEKSDFAAGTSSASTKLVHGGLRYLENFDFRLVFEACRERYLLQRIAPHLVKPLPFCIPVYHGDARPLWMVRAGLTLYDLLALFRNTHPHRILTPKKALEGAPALQPEGLRGAALYWDCRMDDARLVLENILAAADAGAAVANYAQVTGLLHREGRLTGAMVRDGESGQEYKIQARMVVNATGPWLDRVRQLDGEHTPVLRTTRGSHILVPRIDTGGEALYLASGRDNRLFFVIPWGDEMSMVGTTDVDFQGDPDTVWPVEDDIRYLLDEAARHLRGTRLTRGCVVNAFAGLRPLVQDDRVGASQVSREHQVYDSRSGMLSVAGGKYTTYRAVAEQTGKMVCTRLGIAPGRSRTAKEPLPGGMGWKEVQRSRSQWQERYGLAIPLTERLLQRYGGQLPRLLALLDEEPGLQEPVSEGAAITRLEVRYAVEREMARTPADILRRRSTLALERGCGLNELPAVAAQMQQLLGAKESRRLQWEQDYRATEARIGEDHDGDCR